MQKPQPQAHQVWGETPPKLDALASRESTLVMRDLAERQHGVIARRQLIALGLSAETIKGRLKNGYLIPLHHGIFAVGRPLAGRCGVWMAAVLASGPNAVLSHSSAAELWGICGSPGMPEVTRRSGGSHRVGIHLHQTRILEAAEVTVHRGIPVTTIERTLMDIATRFTFRGLERAVVAASRTGQMRWDELQRLLIRTPNRQGVKRLRRVVSVVSPLAEDVRSPLETDFLALCRSAGLPTPSVNVYVVDYLVDFLWPTQRVIVETDGFAYHSDRSAFERDRERTVALTAAGYEVHRATYRMLKRDPQSFLELVRHSLARRSASRLGGISPQT